MATPLHLHLQDPFWWHRKTSNSPMHPESIRNALTATTIVVALLSLAVSFGRPNSSRFFEVLVGSRGSEPNRCVSYAPGSLTLNACDQKAFAQRTDYTRCCCQDYWLPPFSPCLNFSCYYYWQSVWLLSDPHYCFLGRHRFASKLLTNFDSACS